MKLNQVLLALTWIKAYQGKSFIDLEGRLEPDYEVRDSRLHQDVIRIINECNIPVEKEKRMGVKGVISVDCYIPSKNLVIEVHGPYHYSLDGSLNVKSEKQSELVKKLGFKYQLVSYKDWNELKDDDAKKAVIKNLMPSQLNVSASVCLDQVATLTQMHLCLSQYTRDEHNLNSIVLNNVVQSNFKIKHYEKKEFQALFRESKGRGNRGAVIYGYQQLINDIASTQDYPGWFNQINLNMMICGLRNVGLSLTRNNAKTFDIIWVILSDWLPVYDAQGIANSLLALDQMGLRWSNFDNDLQAKLLDSVSNNVEHFNVQEISNSLLALDQMGLRWSHLMLIYKRTYGLSQKECIKIQCSRYFK